MYDDLPDLIYSSDDEPSPPWTPIAPASLTDDQKNSSYRTTNTQTTGTTPHAPYDIRVATHHEDSADSVFIDSDHTHDPPGADETDLPDAQYHHSTDDEKPQPPPPERADPTDYQLLGWISAAIPYSDYRHRLSPTLGKRYGHTLPPNVYRIKPNRWTPLTKSTIPSLSKNAYSHNHARASPGQTTSPQSHPHTAQSTRVSPRLPTTFPRPTRPTRTALTNRPPTPPRPSPTQERQNHTSTRGYVTTYPPDLPSASDQHHRNQLQPPLHKTHLAETTTQHLKTPQNHTPNPSTPYLSPPPPPLYNHLPQPIPYKTSVQKGTNDKTNLFTIQKRLPHTPENRPDLHTPQEDQSTEETETESCRHKPDTIEGPDHPKTTDTTTSGPTGHDSQTADPWNITNIQDTSTCAYHDSHAHHTHKDPRHQMRKVNHGVTATPPIYPRTTAPNKDYETQTTTPPDTAVATKKTHLQPTVTYIATTSVSFDRTKTIRTTKDPASTRQ